MAGFGDIQIDEEGREVGGGMFGQSPVGQALLMAHEKGTLAGLAELAKSAIMGRGGVGKIPAMDPAKQAELIQAAKSGSTDAFEALWNQFKPLLAKLSPRGAPKADMEQEGFLALHRSVMGYDPTRGNFINNLAQNARHDLTRAGARQSGTAVDLPFNILEDQAKIGKATNSRMVRLGPDNPMTPESIASRTGNSLNLRPGQTPLQRVREIQNAPQAKGISPGVEGDIRQTIEDALASSSGRGANTFTDAAADMSKDVPKFVPTPRGRLYKKGS